jgi:two-component system chemotaxis sensor kinase CheA
MADLDLTAFYGQFHDEAWENLNLLEQGLTALEAQPGDTALLDRMLRAIHTTKGSAKIMGFSEINRLAHEIEEVLGSIRKGTIAMTPETVTILLQASSAIRSLTTARIEGRQEPVDVAGQVTAMQRLLGTAPGRPPGEEEEATLAEKPGAEAAPVVTLSAASTGRPRETMRVDLEQVDRMAQLVGEMLALQEQAQEERRNLDQILLAQESVSRALGSLKDRLEAYRDRFRTRQAEEVFQRLVTLEELLQRLEQQAHGFNRRHAVLVERFALAINELQQQALTIRMVPIGTLLEIFPGVVRRMAGEAGTEVALEIHGAEVELDRRVLDQLRDPLLHLVRNALSHGVEPPAERMAQGKDRRGRVVLEAHQQGRRVHVHVQDDGRGIDLEKVRRTAVERGMLDEEHARQADEKALLELLFRPAFSTRRQADDMSGRGVGLDVVQTAMRQLNGFVQVQSQAGQGTTFTLDVPLTLATARVLLVEAAGETMALPAAAVRGLVRVQPEEVVPVEGRPTLYWHGQSLPLLPLAEALGLAAAPLGPGPMPAVIAGLNAHPVALTVDRLLDEAEVVVRPLGDILGQSPYFSAAALSGGGQVIPILDLAGLLARGPALAVAGETGAAVLAPRDPARILLVEDAITTRELERSILEAAGYRVEIAFDGVDALQKLEQVEFQAIITDIEMPRMDGFELTGRVRQDPRWAGLPVIIISARGDEESRRQGLQAGAQGYIAKSRFDQGDLLETIAQLVG